MNHKRKTNPISIPRGGFSFAEMMVAVAILGLLTTVTGMALLNMVNRSRIKQTKVIMDDVMSALIAYRDEIGRWPRDANVCRSINSGTQPDYDLDGFDNGRVLLASVVGKDTKELARMIPPVLPQDWFDNNKWVDDDINDAAMVWDVGVPANEREGIFGEFAEHLLVMMKTSASRMVLAELEDAGFVDRRKATDELVDGGCGTPPGDKIYSVFFVKDAWGTEMLYRRFESENNGFPQLLSAGKDRAFHTDDDLRSTDRD
jgi:prepilin-type N-terminal cleavage/methylation domain-containing protein